MKGLSLDVRTVTKSAAVLKVMRPWWSVVFGLLGLCLCVYGQLRATGVIYTEEWGVEATVVGCVLVGVMLAFFMNYSSLVQGRFEPWQLQERQLRLGINDPISQAPAIFYCNMADNYTFQEATEFVRNLQQNTPQLHYGALTNAVMANNFASPFDRTFMTTSVDEAAREEASPGKQSPKAKQKTDAQLADAQSVEVKLVIESPINRIIRIKLDTSMSLSACTEVATTSAVKAGLLPKGIAIRLAVVDIEGDKCLVRKSKELRAHLLEGSKTGGTAKVFAWPEFTSMPKMA